MLWQTLRTFAIVYVLSSIAFSGQKERGLTLDTEHSQNESPGRPRFAISREQLDALHGDCGLRWSDISRMFGVFTRTMRRRRHELGMAVEGKEFLKRKTN